MKRAADDQAEGDGRPAPAERVLVLSDNFKASDADIELRSSDDVRFLVHKANLASSSVTFANMFQSTVEASRPGLLPVLELSDTARVLERLLPFCYAQRVGPWPSSDIISDLDYISAFDKYEVWRAIESVEAAILLKLSTNRPVAVRVALLGYAFSRHFDLPSLRTVATLALVESTANGPEVLESEVIEEYDLGDLGAGIDQGKVAVAVLRHLACLRSVWTSILMAHMGTFLGDEHAPECMSEWSVRWGAARKDVTKEALLRHLETPWGCGSCDHRLSSGVAKLGEIIEQLEGKLDF